HPLRDQYPPVAQPYTWSSTQGRQMSSNLKTLIGKLNDTCRKAAERAASLCMARGHYEVDLEHLFLALLEEPRADVALVIARSGVKVDSLRRDLEGELARFKTGNSRTPVFSPHLPTLFEHAWLLASLDAHTTRIRGGHLLLALLTQPGLAPLPTRGSVQFAEVRVGARKGDFVRLSVGALDAGEVRAAGAPEPHEEDPGAGVPAGM